MKPPDFAVTFLDLVFSLFASVTMLILLLSATRGTDEYELKGDFLIVRIYWREAVREQPAVESILREPAVVVSGRESTSPTSPPHQSIDISQANQPSTALVVAPVSAAEYSLQSEHADLIDYVVIFTRLGERRDEFSTGSRQLKIVTEPAP